MNGCPCFTIGIPTRNRAALLRQAIHSALGQTEPDFELVVSDNASTDDTSALAASVRDPRFRYVRQDTDLGGARNIEFLVREARGRFFVLNQDDDLLHPEFLARCRAAVGHRADVSLFAGAVVSGAGPHGRLGEDLHVRDGPWTPLSCVSSQAAILDGADAAVMQLFSLPFIPPGVAFNAEILRRTGGFFVGLTWAGDNVTIARTALSGPVLYDLRVAAFLRSHAGSFSRQLSTRTQRACRRVANRLIIQYLDRSAPDWPDRLRRHLAFLPKERRWRFLVEAWEADYPSVLKRLLAESIVGSNRVNRWIAHVSAIGWKGKPLRVLHSRLASRDPDVPLPEPSVLDAGRNS